MEYVFNVGDGRIRESDVPEVVREAESDQNWRAGKVFGIFILLCVCLFALWSVHHGWSINSTLQHKQILKEPNADGTIPVIGSVLCFPRDVNIQSVAVHADDLVLNPKLVETADTNMVSIDRDRHITQMTIVGTGAGIVILRDSDLVKVWQNWIDLDAGPSFIKLA